MLEGMPAKQSVFNLESKRKLNMVVCNSSVSGALKQVII